MSSPAETEDGELLTSHPDTNYGFTLLLRLGLTPLHLAAAISTCDILTISPKALVPSCLNYFFLSYGRVA